jgi:putative FmdB family regulatory protein
MPLYEYRCKACGHRFEKIQTFSAPDEKECPVCKGEVERLISAPAVHFSGSGFYSTDYKAKPPAAPRSSDGGSKGEGSKDGGSKESTSKSSEGSKESPSASAPGDSGSKSSSGSESSSSSTPAPSSTPSTGSN